MKFNRHSELAGRHATLSASKYHWLRYSNDKLRTWFLTQLAAREGSELHEIAALLINKRLKQPRNNKTFNQYVNDAIGFGMTPEQVLFYSIRCFGTADAIVFREIEVDGVMRKELRIHDLKTGVSKASFDQLLIYVGIFLLEYDLLPHEVDHIELRIYQSDRYEAWIPQIEDLVYVIDRIKTSDRVLEEMTSELFGV
jgi:hypothetical protein